MQQELIPTWLYGGNYAKVASCFRAKLPDVNAWWGLAAVVAEKGNLVAAEFLCRKALLLNPTHEYALAVLGGILLQLERYDEAEDILVPLLHRSSDDCRYMVQQNLGFVRFETGKLDSAIELLTLALKSAPEEAKPTITTTLGYAFLKNRDLAKGFELVYDLWNGAQSHMWALGIPEWDGDVAALRGARILVHHHQGYGDTIQFARFMQKLRNFGAHVIAAVPHPLFSLFKYSSVCDEVVDINGRIPRAEFHVSVSLLPAKLKIGLEDLPGIEFPYIRIEHQPPSDDSPYNIGIAWRADGKLTGPRRSVPLKCFLPLTLLSDTQVHSLQFDGSKDIEALGANDLIRDVSWNIRDFADQAAAIAEMDAIVSADTACLHLAGAMGKPCIGLLSYSGADWRWLGNDSTSSPWYPSMRLVHQAKGGSWDEIMDQVIGLLGGD